MISKWQLHLARKTVTARLPFADALRQMKRRVRGYQPNASNIGSTLSDLRRLYALMRKNGIGFHGTVLETGTGWFPVAGIIARLAGADRVLLTDVNLHMDQGTFLTARQIVLDRLDEIASAFDFDLRVARTALTNASAPNELGLIYLAPFDITAVPNASVDLVISRACLEHIPVLDLETLLAGLQPKIRNGGFMAHAIDNSDHFSHMDPGIGQVNFLTWSPAHHRLIWRLARDGENGFATMNMPIYSSGWAIG